MIFTHIVIQAMTYYIEGVGVKMTKNFFSTTFNYY